MFEKLNEDDYIGSIDIRNGQDIIVEVKDRDDDLLDRTFFITSEGVSIHPNVDDVDSFLEGKSDLHPTSFKKAVDSVNLLGSIIDKCFLSENTDIVNSPELGYLSNHKFEFIKKAGGLKAEEQFDKLTKRRK